LHIFQINAKLKRDAQSQTTDVGKRSEVKIVQRDIKPESFWF